MTGQVSIASDIKADTIKFIESFEWDAAVSPKIQSFKDHENLYISYLNDSDDESVFVGSVMLGLLKANQAIQILKTLKPKGELSEIGMAFALCCLQQDYEKNYLTLERIGRKTQMAGSARSLARLEVVELLSFLPDERFHKYAASLITDEVWQHEAIEVALSRYELINIH